MLRVETTKGCLATPRVAMVLEEAATPWERVVRDDGYFTATHGAPGPLLVDGELALLEANAILRHVARTRGAGTLWPVEVERQAHADRWIDFAVLRIGMAVARGEMPAAMGYLGVLDRALAGRDWLCGDFCVADCAYATMLPLAGRLPLDGLSGVKAYLARLGARPAWARVQARLAG
jgi:glutathione S-transferase